MRKIKLFLMVIFLFVLFIGLSESQTPKKRVSKSEEKLKSLEVDKNGCPWVGATTVEYDKPNDLAGFIVYGFRGLFGKNKKFIVDYNCPPNVTKLTLSQTSIFKDCANKEKTCSDTANKIDISVEMFDPEGDVVIYDYKISGGKIIGVGSKVIWDLSDAQPGIYTITAGVDGGQGIIGKQITQEVKVIECPNCN